ncbi:unnamed protein product [marine sediment metagenome]|uniref:Bacterial Pleckstrin homology domain-containing protein n=1 Tax=marine sediment metagenome TaxID=412755 RepID=X0SU28_9ZZZZ
MAGTEIQFDRKDQLNRIQGYVVPGEILLAVYDLKGGGTGFVGITDRRLIFYDQAFLRKKKAMVSVPYSHVTAVASEDSGGVLFATSTLHVTTAGGQTYELRFRSGDKAHNAYTMMIGQILQAEIPG